MNKIFLSYRRSDTGNEIEYIFKHLAYFFGKNNIFLDINSIPPGVDFPSYIRSSVRKSGVVLVVIGNDWITSSTLGLRNKLYDKDDYIRIEIEISIKEGIPIIPILLNGAKMPRKENFPSSIREFTYRNSFPISKHEEIDNDIKDLVKLVNKRYEISYSNYVKRYLDGIIYQYRSIAKIKLLSNGFLALSVFIVGEVAYYNSVQEDATIKYHLFTNRDVKGELKGDEFIRFFYGNVKLMDTIESYAFLSEKAKGKLPLYDYENWWNKTIISVSVNNIEKISENRFSVYLHYKKVNGSDQCSKDIIELDRTNNKWLINDFLWGKCEF